MLDVKGVVSRRGEAIERSITVGDFDESAIKFYKEYYGKSFSQNANKYMYSHSGESIEVAGDVCFNFNLKNGKFFTLYGSIIRDTYNA